MSSKVPPHLPSTRTGRIFAFQSMPGDPGRRCCVFAAIRPLTKVPCQLLGSPGDAVAALAVAVPSPGSDASRSRPLPSFARCRSLMKS